LPEPTWAAGARLAAARWVELEDHVRILTGTPGALELAEKCADVDLTLTQVALLVTTIPMPGADAVRAGLESVQCDLRAGHRPDLRLMACIARWLGSAAGGAPPAAD
jgi:hypothetical protein